MKLPYPRLTIVNGPGSHQSDFCTWAFASSESGSKPPCGNRRVTPNATCLGTSTLPQQKNPFFLGHFTYLYIMYIYVYIESLCFRDSFHGHHSQFRRTSLSVAIAVLFLVFFASPSDSGWNRDHKWPEQITPEAIQTGSKTHPFGHEICQCFLSALNATKSYSKGM